MNGLASGPRRRLSHLSLVIGIGFVLVAVALIYWSIPRSDEILVREDNPRLVERELRLQRGRILDAQNVILAETVGPVDDLQRQYPIATIGPAVGYYSFRHGTAGIEEGYDQILRGESDDLLQDYWQYEVRHEKQIGQDVRLTIQATWQQVADALMGQQQGAIVLLDVATGQVLAMVSHPNYDPNRLEESFNLLVNDDAAPLLNRVTQGQYQPGMVLQPFVLAAAVGGKFLTMDTLVSQVDQPVEFNDLSSHCSAPPPEAATWQDVLALRCPGPMQALSDEFRIDGLQNIFANFGFYNVPPLPIAAESAETQRIDEPGLAIIGQDNLTVSPMQIAMALVSLANGGQLAEPDLVLAVQNQAGEWQAPEATKLDSYSDFPSPVVPASAANEILQALPLFRGISEHSAAVLSGPQGTTNVWYLGLAPAGQPRFAVVVIIEDEDELFAAQRVGRTLLQELLDPAEE